MAFIGNQPVEQYSSIAKQDITGNGGTTYTLNAVVTSPEDIEVFINNVRQEPTTSYGVSGTTLTLTEALASTDDCYVVYQGRTVGTKAPGDNTVGTGKIQANAVTHAKLNTDMDLTGKTVKLASIVSSGGTTSMTIAANGTPTLASPPSITTPILLCAHSITTLTAAGVVPYTIVSIDTASGHDTSTGRYTCPRAGYYEVSFNYLLRNCAGHRTNVRKNTVIQNVSWNSSDSNRSLVWSITSGVEVNMAATTIVQCAQNDILDVHMYYINGGDIYGSGNIHNQLVIKYLG